MDLFMENIKSVITRYNMIAQGDSIVVGVSGGPDSMCLLHVLKELAPKYDLKLFAVHLNHCFRGREADEDADYVRSICSAWEIPSFIEKVDVPAYAEKNGLSPEEAGREVRYRLFDETAEKVGASKIAVAQNMNDQIETVLMRFLRGSGLEGLKGIEPVRGNIIRPLIETQRDAIEGYCAAYGLNPRIDKTNLQPVYLRNKIRLELLPYLKQNFNPNIAASIMRFSNLAKEENSFLEEQVLKASKEIVQQQKDKVYMDITRLGDLHPAIRRRMVRMCIETLAGSLTGFEYKNFENVLALADKPTGAAVILPHGLKAYVSYNNLIISKIVEIQDKKCYYKLKYHDDNHIPENDVDIAVEQKSADETVSIPKDGYMVYIDNAKIHNGLVYRNRLEGDMFSPIGMKGSKKLKDYFIDEKIPKEERDRVELIADGKEIIWIIGKRLSEKYKVTKDTKDIIVITYRRGQKNGE